jgi:hypothetical protein
VPGDPEFIPLPEERRPGRDHEIRPEPPPFS